MTCAHACCLEGRASSRRRKRRCASSPGGSRNRVQVRTRREPHLSSGPDCRQLQATFSPWSRFPHASPERRLQPRSTRPAEAPFRRSPVSLLQRQLVSLLRFDAYPGVSPVLRSGCAGQRVRALEIRNCPASLQSWGSGPSVPHPCQQRAGALTRSLQGGRHGYLGGPSRPGVVTHTRDIDRRCSPSSSTPSPKAGTP